MTGTAAMSHVFACMAAFAATQHILLVRCSKEITLIGCEGRHGNGLSQFFAPVAAWFARQHRIDQMIRTLNQRSDRQLADMGLSRADIPAVARGLPVPPRHEYDDSARPTFRPVSILPIALMR